MNKYYIWVEEEIENVVQENWCFLLLLFVCLFLKSKLDLGQRTVFDLIQWQVQF